MRSPVPAFNGRAACGYGCGVAHRDHAKVVEHMKICDFTPFTVEVIDTSDLEDKLRQLHQSDRDIVAILPWEYSEGDFYDHFLSRVKIISRLKENAHA